MGGNQAMSGVIAGIGCRRGCPADAIVTVLRRASALAGQEASTLAAPAFKSAEPGLKEAAQRLGLMLIFVSSAALAEAQARCVTVSARAAQATGVASVAEGCALAAAGVESRLILPRISGDGATCALAAP